MMLVCNGHANTGCELNVEDMCFNSKGVCKLTNF